MTVQLESKNHRKIRELNTLAHRNFQETYDLVYPALRNMNEGRVLVLVGPSRVGKSELMRRVRGALLAEIRPLHDDDQPILTIEADLGNDARMSMKQFAAEGLHLIRHPVFADLGEGDDFPAIIRLRGSEGFLRLLFLKSMKCRGTLYLIVDEAHHLLMTMREKLQSDILDALKNVCNKANVVLVLFGGYRLLDGLFQSAHFNGRMEIVHFQGYTSSSEDLMEYSSVLASLQQVVPVSERDLFVKNAEEIRTLFWGAIGATIEGIRAAETRRIARGSPKLEMRDVYSGVLPDKARRTILDDVKHGLDFFAKELPPPLNQGSDASQSSATKEETTSGPKRKRKPFKKNPVRRTSPKVEVK
jgi:AAA domain